ncbi:MAG: metallophosphoesterase family protein [Chloroflexota bacterium]|nr:metallophosphoesterase family protein [Chloroflexota bacterium]
MKLAVLSDIHGNLTALEAVLADLEAVGGADHLWILGDLALMGARPAECVQRVRTLVEASKPEKKEGEGEAPAADPAVADPAPGEVATPKMRVRAISGNTDRYLVYGSGSSSKEPAADAEAYEKLRQRYKFTSQIIGWTSDRLSFDDYTFLAKLPGELDLHVPGYGYVIGYHAVPGDDEAYLKPDTLDSEAADFLLDREGRLGIGGHIHQQMDRHLTIGGWRVINDGSVGMSYERAGHAQWGLIVFDGGDAHVDLRNVPYDVDAALDDARAAEFPQADYLARVYRDGKR